MDGTVALAGFALAAAHEWGHAGWMWIGPVISMLWFGLIAGVGILVWRRIGRGALGHRGPHSEIGRAREILAERFARGELTADEYWERLAALH
jgi:putative membrane protein